jgi:hypothetical protein
MFEGLLEPVLTFNERLPLRHRRLDIARPEHADDAVCAGMIKHQGP